jgi:hypothetical protein
MGPTDHSYQANRVHPFFLIYGADTVLPEEISYASPRVHVYDKDKAEEAL